MAVRERARRIVFAASSAFLLLPAAMSCSGAEDSGNSSEARLVDFDSAGRIEGAFYIQLKGSQELEAIATASTRRPKVLPDLRLTTQEAVARLANEMAARVSGKVSYVVFNANRVGFGLTGVREKLLREEIASDRRVALIAPEIAVGPRK